MEDSTSAGYVSALRATRADLLMSARKCLEGEKAARKRGDTRKADTLKGEALAFSIVANMIDEVVNRSADDWRKMEEGYGAKGGTT